ncbi:hypothetical protein J4481_00655 [Candidatus Pacearchaeota archaeon]|nr:hypothetical protein [Candidatus Pacearchaeota archaeon]
MDQTNFTSGLGIIRIEGTATIPAGQEVKVLDTIISDNLKRDEIFQHWRGQIINNSLFIENKIDSIITNLLFKQDVEKSSLFKSVILSREFFGFMSKWKVLRNLLKTLMPFKDKDYSELFKDLHFIIDERDKFAHGQVSYSGMRGEKIFLTYFKEISKKEEITESTIITFKEVCSRCHQELDKIIPQGQTLN